MSKRVANTLIYEQVSNTTANEEFKKTITIFMIYKPT